MSKGLGLKRLQSVSFFLVVFFIGSQMAFASSADYQPVLSAKVIDCLIRYEQQESSEFFIPEHECPGLQQALVSSELSKHLPTSFTGEVDINQLYAFHHLLNAARADAIEPRWLDHDALKNILADVYQATDQTQHKSWWQRFLEWLYGHFSSSGGEEYAKRFLDWLNQYIPLEIVLPYIVYVSLALLVIIVLGVLIREIWLAQAWPQFSWFRLKKATMKNQTGAEEKPLDLTAVRRLPVRLQVAALLQFCIEHLIAKGVLPEQRHYTNFELLSFLIAVNSAFSEHFSRVVNVADQALYGDGDIAAATVEALYKDIEILTSEQMQAQSIS